MLKSPAHSRMFDLGGVLRHFDVRVNNPVSVLKKWRQITAGKVTIFIDSSRKNRPAMLSKPLWIVRTPTEE
jgi:hypothetical protein